MNQPTSSHGKTPLPLLAILIAAWCASASAQDHWSFKPRAKPDVPRFDDASSSAWVRNGIDAFVLARLHSEGLLPSPEADRSTLIRRLYFDLTGLPPQPGEVDAFVNDESPDAYERLVERLLASPRYGERWAQHWLDVARFAESEGFEYDRHLPGAWRYRDYVVESFNRDKPFDQFIVEQLAGDELKPGDREMQVAVGFLRLGPIRRNAGNQTVAFSRNEVLTEMTDTIGMAFMALTVGCARCHNHRFDDFSQVEYYRMQAFLAATHERNVVLAEADAQAKWNKRTDRLNAEIKALKKRIGDATDAEKAPLLKKLKALQKQLPDPLPTICTVGDVDDKRSPIHVLRRGLPERKGKRVQPGFPSALVAESAIDLPPAQRDKPRVALARWLSQPDHPLTARVLVNRLWQYHFGIGIVETANDFGDNGGKPSHPELLDYLANELVRNGMRQKPLHRMIVLSAAYRQASRASANALGRKKDPDNRLLWRFPRRRLSAEEIRDGMLAAAGRLNLKTGGRSVIVPVEKDLIDLLYDPAQWKVTPNEREHDRRSIYLMAKRNLRTPFGQVFDQPDLQTTCPRREESTHSLQALEMLNGRTANRLADAFAARLRREAGSSSEKQVNLAFRLTAGRAPTAREKRLAVAFLKDQPLREFALATFSLNAFLYVD